MVERMTTKPLIPMVDLVRHYREFKSVRVDGRLEVGNYHSQESRLRLADRYLADPSTLISMFRESVSQFREYNNPDESFVGEKRSAPSTVSAVEQITTGPRAAAYLARSQRHLSIENLGEYEYVDREVVPARTTSKKAAAMANRFDDANLLRSTTAMKADILLRSLSGNRPTIGEVKVSSRGGDDADPVYGLVQSLALASQLVGNRQRVRLNKHYPAVFAAESPVDIMILLFEMHESAATNRKSLVLAARGLCQALSEGALLPHVGRVALVTATPNGGRLDFTA
jgi:hypothetical protein